MTLYPVFREGVYRHECLAVFDNFDKAKFYAILYALADDDCYHTYEVIAVPLNTPLSGRYSWNTPFTPTLFSARNPQERNYGQTETQL